MTYKLTVNYDTSIESLIEQGKYDWANSDINETNFPSEEAGKSKIEVELVGFDKNISSGDAQGKIIKMGLEPLTLKELLHLGIKYPSLQQENPIVALGSTWRNPDGIVRVPYLGRDDSSDRDLDLSWSEGDWPPSWRFVAVRK